MKASRSQKETSRKKGPSFAPPSEIRDLSAYLKPTRGPVLEVLVAWKERIISCYYFPRGKKVVLGPEGEDDVRLPSAFISRSVPLLDSGSADGIKVYLVPQMTPEIRQERGVYDLDLLNSQGRIKSGQRVPVLFLEQGELLSLQLGGGVVQIFIRHVPITLTPPAKGVGLTGRGIAVFLLSCSFVWLFAFYISADKARRQAREGDNQPKLAKFVYDKKMEPLPEIPPVQGVTEVKKEPVKLKKAALPPPVKKDEVVDILDEPVANEVVKEVAKEVVKKDVKQVGLLSAFGGKINRKNLDKASGGAKDLLGEVGASTGFSGYKAISADDLGGKFKNVGTERTATQGIAGVSTQGRSAGQISYGRVGAGRKGAVALELVDRGVEFVGTVDREQVRRVVRSILSQIKGCFDRALAMNLGLEGKIVILWEVGEQGRVRAARVKEAAEELRGVAVCAMGKIHAQKFPEPPTGSYYEVSYPFLMSRQE